MRPAVDFIAELRQASDLAALPVGRRVVVIGGGMTAIDAGVQAKKLGAEEVTIVYRRGRERMAASGYEQELAANAGVRIVCDAVPVAVSDGAAMVFAYTEPTARPGRGALRAGGRPGADRDRPAARPGARGAGGRRRQDRRHRAGPHQPPGVWAGGDCASGGDDLTVTAVAEGRDAAMDIHAALTARP